MKTKALISFAVTAKLICVFVFAYAKSRFSHNEAHFIRKCILHCHNSQSNQLFDIDGYWRAAGGFDTSMLKEIMRLGTLFSLIWSSLASKFG